MAKKIVETSAEDRLAAALVPAKEQPYPIPGNWVWCHLSDALSTSKEKTEKFSDPSVRYVGLEHMEKDGGIVSYGSPEGIKSLKNVFHSRQILYGKLRPYLNKHDIATFDGICSTDILVFDALDSVTPEFVNYYLSQDYFIGYAADNSKGINLPRVSETVVLAASFPLPPLPEQRRIIERIESLFVQLDEARDEAQAIIDGFEDRKAAILHKAFNGELTKEWRKQHNVSAPWTKDALINVSVLQTGLMKGKSYTGATVSFPYLRVANVQDGYLDLNEMKEIEVPETLVERYLLRKGDVLFTEGGDYDKLGRGTVWEGQIGKCLHQNHVFVVRPHTSILDPYFLSLQAGSQYGKKYFLSCSKQTTNLASINSTQLKNFPVLIPSLDEQREIVHRLDSLLAQEAEIKAAAEATIDQISAMKQAILARAFRGELGTNDPTDEPALELLKRAVMDAK